MGLGLCGMSRDFLNAGEGRATSIQVDVCGMLWGCQGVRCGRGSCSDLGIKGTGRDCFYFFFPSTAYLHCCLFLENADLTMLGAIRGVRQ